MIRMDKSLTVDISLANQSNPKIRREFVERGRAHCEACPCFLPPAAARLFQGPACSHCRSKWCPADAAHPQSNSHVSTALSSFPEPRGMGPFYAPRDLELNQWDGGSQKSLEDHHRCGDNLHHDSWGSGDSGNSCAFWGKLNMSLVQSVPPKSQPGGALVVGCGKESNVCL